MSQMWMVCYDIADDRRRQRVAGVLEAFGERVQWSVFECYLTPVQRVALRDRLRAELDAAEDSVRWYPLCVWCRERVVCVGPVGPTDDPPYFVV